MRVLALDIGGTAIKIGVINERGKLLIKAKYQLWPKMVEKY